MSGQALDGQFLPLLYGFLPDTLHPYSHSPLFEILLTYALPVDDSLDET